MEAIEATVAEGILNTRPALTVVLPSAVLFQREPNIHLETSMKKITLFALALSLAAAGAARAAEKPAAAPAKPAQAAPATAAPAQAAPATPAAPPSAGAGWPLQDKAGYIIGLNLGNNLRQQEIPVTADQIIKGLRDGLGNAKAQLTDEEIQATMGEFQKQLMAKQQEKMKVVGDKNKQEGDAFLAANKSKPGVKTTASGLQYQVLTEGTGPTPKPTDKVTVNYKGQLLDGKVFDSSYDRGQPVTFGVSQVIPGWVEALQLMKAGSKYKLFIPANLAYGENGAGGDIGPNATLQFEVEMLKIEPGDAPDADAPAAGEQPTPEPQKPPTR
jgi:FKBP-type peptidyl-prolyl cis-trans isomerase